MPDIDVAYADVLRDAMCYYDGYIADMEREEARCEPFAE